MCGLKFIVYTFKDSFKVAPFAGVWIEIDGVPALRTASGVAPFAGVWIEIDARMSMASMRIVAPFAGVWIEITYQRTCPMFPASHPSRVCGLK